jgi:hypothetical protein
MLFTQTGLTYFYKWPITCEIQILNLINCGSGICNRCDQRLFLLASRFFPLAKSLWNQGTLPKESKLILADIGVATVYFVTKERRTSTERNHTVLNVERRQMVVDDKKFGVAPYRRKLWGNSLKIFSVFLHSYKTAFRAFLKQILGYTTLH